MRSLKYLAVVLGFLLSFALVNAEEVKKEEPKQEDKVTGSVAAGVYNRYIFRGYELSSGSVVIQPSITVSYKGFSLNYWETLTQMKGKRRVLFPTDLAEKALMNLILL